ncbi:uncharacterized protein LOC120701390 [Panicum virgatum]|uniref:Uncharacterized protein n=1 Tax=Panicum virgatum TaxID=38727 RepID=A0A8T0V7A3_PANVG|nr:uncharacterized protein LOC120701390 [Panicum virgatum]KAG2627909.1 hypothetical protein PVAP13_3KG265398 [Panicum virgatum]
MGNGLSPCLCPGAAHGAVARLVFWGGSARTAGERRRPVTAGDVAAELPGQHLVCAADSFFIGLPVPALPPGERLVAGRTYFVLPAARFSCRQALTAATLAKLSPSPAAKVPIAGGAASPFEYVTGADGAPLIRILPEFIEKVITSRGGGGGGKCGAAEQLCSTPELRKHYMQLVGARAERPWSPGLETISEAEKRRRRPSPVRLIELASKASSR